MRQRALTFDLDPEMGRFTSPTGIYRYPHLREFGSRSNQCRVRLVPTIGSCGICTIPVIEYIVIVKSFHLANYYHIVYILCRIIHTMYSAYTYKK